jgi:hypothetical protein
MDENEIHPMILTWDMANREMRNKSQTPPGPVNLSMAVVASNCDKFQTMFLKLV